MAIIDFPSSPSVNDTYSFGNKTWVFNGQGWQLVSSSAINDVVIGNITPASGNFTTVGATGNITASGNIAGNYILGNGAFLTGIAAGYSNANVKDYLGNFDGNIIPSANVTYDLGSNTNRWNDLYLNNSTIYIGAQEITANASTTVFSGNVAANYLFGNASFLIGVSDYSNANVANYLPNYQGLISNVDFRSTSPAAVALVVTDRPLTMGGNSLSYVTLPDDGNANSVAAELTNHGLGNVLISAGPADYEWIFDHTGNLTLPGSSFAVNYANGAQVSLAGTYSNINVKAYLESGSMINANFDGGTLYATGIANLGPTTINGNLAVAGNITASGNLTYINVQDLVIDDPLIQLAANNPGDVEDLGIVAGYNDGTARHTGFARDYTDQTWKVFTGVTSDPNTVIAWSQAVYAPFKAGPILSNASITANANVTATGNVSGSYLLGNGAFITGLPAGYSNADLANYLASNAAVTILTTGNITTQGNVAGAWFIGNINATNTITTTGNITANNFIGSDPNVGLVAGSYTWLFDDTGNFNLPGNSFNVNYANGVQVSLGGTYSNAEAANYLASNANVTILTTGNITTQGNITGNYILGNGALLTGLPATYSNANVANYLPTYTGNLASLTGNVTTTANVAGAWFIGNINATNTITTTGNITANNFIGSDPNVGLVANGYTWLFDNTGNVTLPGNVWAVNYANGTPVSLAGTYANANVATYLASNAAVTILTTGNITTSGNVSGAYILGNGAFLTDINAGNIIGGYGNSQVAAYLQVYNGNALFSNVTVSRDVVVLGNLRVEGNTTEINVSNIFLADKDIIVAANANATLSDLNGAGLQIGNRTAGGNITFFYDSTSNVMSLSHGANIANVLNVTGNITATGNVTANFLLGNIRSATGGYDDANVAAYTGALTNLTGNVTTTANITANNFIGNGATLAGNLSAGNVSVANGNITVGNLVGAGTNVEIVSGAYTWTFDGAGNLTGNGNISAGNFVGTAGNTSIVTGAYAWVFNDAGNFVLPGNSFSVNYANGIQVSLGGSYSNSEAANYLASNAAVTILTTGNITTSANIAGNYFIGNGALLTGLPATYSNSNVAAYLASNSNITLALGTGNITTQGNITAGNLSVANGNITLGNLVGSGTNVEIVSGAYTWTFDGAGNLTGNGNISAGNFVGTAGNTSIVTNAYSWTFNDSGNLVLPGNTFAINYANGQQVSLSGNYSNSNVAAYLPTYTGNLASLTGNVTTSANVTGAYLLGNGYFVSGIQYGNITGAYSNANVLNYLESGATINANFGGGTLKATGVANLGPTTVNGNLVVAGNISATGNLTYISVQDLVIDDPLIQLAANNPGDVEDLGIVAGYNDGTAKHTGFVRDYTDSTWKVFANVTSEPNTVINWSQAVYAPFKAGPILSNASITANANVTATGNVSGSYLLGNGYFISGIQYSNITGTYGNSNVAAYLPTYTGNLASLTGNVTTTANISGSYLLGNGAFITGLPAGYSNADVANYLPTYTGNVSAGNLNLTGNIVDTGPLQIITAASGNIGLAVGNSNVLVASTNGVNVTGYFSATGDISTQGNITVASIQGANANTTIVANVYSWAFDDTGNLTLPGNSFAVNYANGTQVSLGGSYSNSEAANYLASNAAVTILTTGNITTSGNIAGNYFIGNGALLTGLPATYSNANVANYLPTYTGNVSAGNLNLTGNIVDTGALTMITGSAGNITLAPNSTSVLIATTTGVNIAGYMNATGNLSAGNFIGSGTNVELTAGSYTWIFDNSGNFTLAGNTFAVNYANGAQVSLSGTYANSNVSAYLASNAAVTVLTTGNITTSANVSGAYILGNGAFLSGLPATYSNSNVAAYLAVYNGNALFSNITVSQDAVVLGNLRVEGNTTYINVSDLIVEDKDIIVAANASATLTDLNGAGLQIGNRTAGGNITFFYNSTSNVMSLSHGANIANVLNVTGNITATGNTTSGNVNLTGNIVDTGALTIVTGAGGNITLAPNSTSVLIATTTGVNIAGYLNTTGNISAGNVIGSGNNVEVTAGSYNWAFDNTGNFTLSGNTFAVNYANGTAVSIAGTYSNTNVAAYLASNAAVTILTTANITTAANIAGNYILGNGAFLTGLPEAYGNANVANYLPTYTGNLGAGNLNLTGNIVDTGALTIITGSSGNITLAPGNTTVLTVTTTGVNVSGTFNATGNISAGNLIGSGNNVEITAGSYNWLFDNTGNFTLAGNSFSLNYANGSQVSLSGTYSNSNVKTYLESGATINANFGGGNITTTGTANLGITQVNGNLVVTGNISATGNITYINVSDLVVSDPLLFLAANNPGDTEDIGLVANYNTGGGNLHTGFARDYTDSTWKLFQGVTSDPNTVIAWNEAVYAPLKAGSILSNASITANANVTAVGNVSGTYLLGNGYFVSGIQYSNITGAYSNATVANYLASNAAVTILTTGNITTSANISAGNIVGAGTNTTITTNGYTWTFDNTGNLTTPGNIEVTANVIADYFIGNGAFLTGLPAGYSNADAANYLASNAAVTILTTGNITTSANIAGNYILGNGSQLTGISTSSIFNGNSNVSIDTAAGNTTVAVNGVNDVVIVSHAANLGALFIDGVYTNGRDLGNANVPDGVNSMLIGPITIGNSSVVGVGNDARLVIL